MRLDFRGRAIEGLDADIPRERVPEIVGVIRERQGTLSPEAITAHVENLKARHGAGE